MDPIVIAGVVGLFVLVNIVRVVRKHAKAMLRPPLTIQLVPVDDRAKGRFADAHRRELETIGFTPVGIYQVREIPGVTLVALTHAAQSVCAVVYRHPIAGVFLDVCTMYEDGRSVTVTTAPAGQNLDQPPGRTKLYEKERTARQLYERLLSERPAGAFKRIDASNFMRMFEAEYANEMAWRKQRGGPTAEEVRREAHAMGIRSEKTIEKATEQLRKQYHESSQPGVR